MTKTIDYTIAEKLITLYPAEKSDMPLIVLNNFSGNGDSVVKAMNDICCADCNLISIGNLRWDHDMTPWYCPPLSKNDTPCTGGADEYLKILMNEILPATLSKIDGAPNLIGIAGYSLAGLFALYTMYRTDLFSRVASISGSLWFPDFKEYAVSNELQRKPDRLYLSLGDKEAKSRNPLLKAVQDNTEFLSEYYHEIGIHTELEMNEGNHFKNAALRTAKGIAALLK